MNDYEKLQSEHIKLLEKLNTMQVNGRNYIHLQRAIQICEASSRGIFKRIDENRELLEALQREIPELLERCPWITSWIARNDQFFVDLAEAVGVDDIFDQDKYGHFRQYPRPWPENI